MAVAKKTSSSPTAGMTEGQAALFDKIMSEFFELSGWKNCSDEDKQKAFADIDERILLLETQIEQLKRDKEEFDSREDKVIANCAGMVKMLSRNVDSGANQILELLCIQHDVPMRKKTSTRQPKVTVAQELRDEVLEVMDREGMTASEILKRLPQGTSIQGGAMLSKILLSLRNDDRVGTRGQRRSTQYFLIDPEVQEEEPAEE